jgi:hypothetical protein
MKDPFAEPKLDAGLTDIAERGSLGPVEPNDFQAK